MNREKAADLQDEALALEARAMGKRMEAAMEMGNSEEARRCLHTMYGLIDLRRAAKFAMAESKEPCYFVTAGEADGSAIRA